MRLGSSRRLALLLAALAALLLGAGTAHAYEVDLTVGKEAKTAETADSCHFAIVFPFAEVPGAVGYRGTFQLNGGYTIDEYRPAYVDTIQWGDTPEQSWSAGAGQHWFNGTVGGGGRGNPPGPCGSPDGYLNGWQVLEAKAIMPDPVIKGHVRYADGSPATSATVTIKGATNTYTYYTDGQGAYATGGLERGSYEVSVTGGGKQWCVDQSGSCLLKATRTLGPDATIDFVERTAKVKGRIVAGSDGTHPNDAQPARDVPVRVVGTSQTGTAVDLTARTDQDGQYAAPVKPGTYDVRLPDYACVRDSNPCTRNKTVTVATDEEATVDGVAQSPLLDLTVEAPDTTLEQAASGWVPRIVTAKITVRNHGDVAARAVTLHPDLQIGFKDRGGVPIVPVSAAGAPDHTDLGTIAPGGEASATIPLRVEGDGEYEIDALADALTGDGRAVLSPGRGTLKVGGRFVYTKYTQGYVPISKGMLIRGGDAWYVDVHVANRSYTKKVVLNPVDAALKGNAQDGHSQPADEPTPKVDSLDAAAPGRYIELGPRESKDLKVVVRTSLSDTFDDSAPKKPGKGAGGTQSLVTIKDQTGNLVTADEHLGAPLSPDDFLFDGGRDYRVGVDDSAATYDQQWWLPQLAINYSNVAAGVLEGLWNFTAGGAKGLFVDVLGRGIVEAPGAVINFASAQAELFRAIAKQPAVAAELLAYTRDQAAKAYALAPVYADKLSTLVDEGSLNHMRRLSNEWYAGDYEAALREISSDGTEIGLTVIPAVVARVPYLRTLATRAAAETQSEVLGALAKYQRSLDFDGAAAALKSSIKPGIELKYPQLAKFYGYTKEQVDWLADFARRNKLVIVARNRAGASIKWLKKHGAVLKPEAIKIKNVDFVDVQYLGYREGDLGRVVVPRHPPELKDVLKRMSHLKKSSTEYAAVIKRYEARVDEFRKSATKPGYVKWLRDSAGHGENGRVVQLKWNMRDNWMDPRVARDSLTPYRLRMRIDGDFEVPEFFVKGQWRSITGDMDLLQVTGADGRPLEDAMRLKIYQQLANGPLGLMHPETATWTMASGKFDFAAKLNEFVRSEIPPVQFGFDGKVRAVRFANDKRLYDFTSKAKYKITWIGGVQYRTTSP